MKFKATIVIIFVATSVVFGQFYYWTAAIGIDFGEYVILVPKVSIGAARDVNTVPDFMNITAGIRIPLIIEHYVRVESKDYIFIELEYGHRVADRVMLYYGGGAGIGFMKKWKRYPKASIFVGNLLFLRSDILFTSFQEPLVDIGLMPVLPVPISPFSLDF